jgi:hypothetical protein
MNSRRARRLATIRLAAAARSLSTDAAAFDELNPADRRRIGRAFDDLAHELEVRAGLTPRVPHAAPIDPDQVHLFEINREN